MPRRSHVSGWRSCCCCPKSFSSEEKEGQDPFCSGDQPPWRGSTHRRCLGPARGGGASRSRVMVAAQQRAGPHPHWRRRRSPVLGCGPPRPVLLLLNFSRKVVLDVGTGSGILAIWSAQADARKVYAIEATNVAEHAHELVRANGLANIVEVIQGTMEDIVLPEKADSSHLPVTIQHDTIGGFGRPMYEDGTTKAVLAASPGDEDAVRSKVMVGRKGTKVLTNEAGEVTRQAEIVCPSICLSDLFKLAVGMTAFCAAAVYLEIKYIRERQAALEEKG